MQLPFSTIAIAFAAGGVLGWLYLRALWHAVQQVTAGHRSGAWMAAMLLARLSAAALVLWLTARWGGWQGLVAALSGFVAARALFMRRDHGERAPS